MRILLRAQYIRILLRMQYMRILLRVQYMTNGVPDRDVIVHKFVNSTNCLKQTPLMFAAYHGRDEVVQFLLKQVGAQCQMVHPYHWRGETVQSLLKQANVGKWRIE